VRYGGTHISEVAVTDGLGAARVGALSGKVAIVTGGGSGIGLTTLFRRIPDLALAAPIEQLPFKDDNLTYGVYELPVVW
jgi:hypothetical protein